MPSLSVSLNGGTLSVVPAESSGSRSVSGFTARLAILDQHAAAQDAIYQTYATVDSANAYQALPWPTGMQGRFLYIRRVEPSINEPFHVRLTKSTTGAETLRNQRGMLLLEFAEDDYLESVEIQGSVTIEWAATGRRD